MGLRTALVDRAVRLRKAKTGKRVEGTTVYEDAESDPIRVRLEISAAAEQSEGGVVVTEPTPNLLVFKRDLEGNYLTWKATDRLRVTSQQLGEDIYEIDGEPVPLRRKRRVIGWQLRLRRVEENQV
jgi:hypothetical protein